MSGKLLRTSNVDGKVLNHTRHETFSEAIDISFAANDGKSMCYISLLYRMMVDSGYVLLAAHMVQGRLVEYFQNEGGTILEKVPERFHAEVAEMIPSRPGE